MSDLPKYLCYCGSLDPGVISQKLSVSKFGIKEVLKNQTTILAFQVSLKRKGEIIEDEDEVGENYILYLYNENMKYYVHIFRMLIKKDAEDTGKTLEGKIREYLNKETLHAFLNSYLQYQKIHYMKYIYDRIDECIKYLRDYGINIDYTNISDSELDLQMKSFYDEIKQGRNPKLNKQLLRCVNILMMLNDKIDHILRMNDEQMRRYIVEGPTIEQYEINDELDNKFYETFKEHVQAQESSVSKKKQPPASSAWAAPSASGASAWAAPSGASAWSAPLTWSARDALRASTWADAPASGASTWSTWDALLVPVDKSSAYGPSREAAEEPWGSELSWSAPPRGAELGRWSEEADVSLWGPSRAAEYSRWDRPLEAAGSQSYKISGTLNLTVLLSSLETSLSKDRGRLIKPEDHQCGTVSLGSTCFLNSVLQLLYIGFGGVVLTHRSFFLKKDEDGNNVDNFMKALLYIFILFYTNNLGGETAVNLKVSVIDDRSKKETDMSLSISLYEALYRSFTPIITKGQSRDQQDDNEYLVHILDLISSSKNRYVRSLSQLHKFTHIESFEYKEFDGEEKPHSQRDLPFKTYVKSEESILELPLLGDKTSDLNTLLSAYYGEKPFEEHLGSDHYKWFDDERKDKSGKKTIQKMRATEGNYQNMPYHPEESDLLFIHLKRAANLGGGGKISAPIKIPFKFQCGLYMWELVCATCHSSSVAANGHYYAVTKFDTNSPSTRQLEIKHIVNDSINISHDDDDEDNDRYRGLFDMEKFFRTVTTVLYKKVSRVHSRFPMYLGVDINDLYRATERITPRKAVLTKRGEPREADLTGREGSREAVLTGREGSRAAASSGWNKYMKYKLKYLKLKKMLTNQ